MDLKELKDVKLPVLDYPEMEITDDSSPEENIRRKIRITYKFILDEDAWSLKGRVQLKISGKSYVAEEKIVLPKDLVTNLEAGNISIDEFCQHSQVTNIMFAISERIIIEASYINTKSIDFSSLSSKRKMSSYVPQATIDGKERGKNIVLDNLLTTAFSSKGDLTNKVPKPYRCSAPTGIVEDSETVQSIMRYLAFGHTTVALIGPTGVGKSITARYIGNLLNRKEYWTITVDGNERTEGDRLFDRDDFNEKGTFLLPGTLCSFAKATKEAGVHGLVILEEYNAFSDGTRREFYRLFNNEDERYYIIQSSKSGLEDNRVDFSHIQFLITGNPMTDKYLTDDLKAFSNAEKRRITFLFQDYAKDPNRIKDIIRSIVERQTIYKKLEAAGYISSSKPNYTKGVKLFKCLTETDDKGQSIGHDFGYSDIAEWVWYIYVMGETNTDSWINATINHLLVPVQDLFTREIICQRIEVAFGITIPKHLMYLGI